MKSNMRTSTTISKIKLALAVMLAVLCAVTALAFVSVPQAQGSQVGFPMYSWGDNVHGRLGRPVTAESPAHLPGRVGDRADWIQSATAAGGSFAISRQGRLYAWGTLGTSNNMGQGGTAGSGALTEPTRIGTASDWVSVSARSATVAAINSRGQLFTWGSNANGQLGHDDTDPRNIPTRVGTRSDWEQVSVGGAQGNFVVAITTTGHLYAWGNQANVISNQTTPERIGSADNWTSISTGGSFAIAINRAGELFTWGGNTVGELGRTPNATFPQDQPGPVDLGLTGTANNWLDARTTGGTAAAVNASGHMYTWGSGSLGQLGRPSGGTHPPADRPGRVGTANNWVSVMGGNSHFLAFNRDRQLWAWGNNADRQLGIPLASGQNAPAYVATVERFSSAARGGGTHSIMLLEINPAQARIDLTKHLQKPEGTPDPEAEFTFNVVRYSFNHSIAYRDRLPEIDPIVLTPSLIINPNAPNAAPAGITTRMDDVNIFEGVEFFEEGRFTFRVSEELGSSGLNAPGNYTSPINYSRAEYEISVYITVDPEDEDELIVRAVTVYRIRDRAGNLVDPLDPSRKIGEDEFIFTNYYIRTVTDALEVSKYIEGQFANLNETFTFTITLTPTAFCPDPTNFTGRRINAADALVNPQPVFTRNATTGITTVTVTLGHNERFVLDGNVVVGTGFEVVEAPCPYHIARAIVIVGGVPLAEQPYNEVVNEELSTGLHHIGVGTNSAGFTNEHQFAAPTGLLIENNLPFVFLIAAALMAGTLVAVKSRRRIEDMPMGNFQHSMQVSGIVNNIGEGEN